METFGFQESWSTKHAQNTQENVNGNYSDTADSVMTEDFIPSTQNLDVAKSTEQSYSRQLADNVAIPSCSPAKPGLDLH
jgi:hypothetical protein